MAGADIVVSSTGCPETILDGEDVEVVMRQRPNRPLFLIDIAVPRDIDPAAQGVENVFLYDIDDLEKLVAENVRLREQELAPCREIIEKHTAELTAKLNGPSRKPEAAVQPQASWEFPGRIHDYAH
jgi:glutamyl-tRNA reductase